MAWTDKLAEFLRLNDGQQAYTGYPQMQVGLNKPRQAGYATGFLEGATGAESMQPKNPITDPNYSAYEQGKNIGEAVGIGAMAVPGYVAALKASAPKAYNALENYMVKSGGMIPLEAYHGTPHKIEGAFDIKKIGTGEGNQVYGPGMYFAESPSVATQYRNLLSKPEFTKTGEGIELRGQLPRMLDESYSELVAKNGLQQTNYGDVTDIVGQRLDRQMKDALKANDMGWYNKVADMKMDLARFKEKPPKNTGNIYKVDIPNEKIPNMLDWDKPLNQQPTVLQAINNLGARQDLPKGFDQAISRALESKHFDGQDLYYELTKVYKDPEMLRTAMEESGFTGIRYLDQGSRGTGKGTSNFVVFDPSNVKILEENSKPVSRKALIEEQVKKLKD